MTTALPAHHRLHRHVTPARLGLVCCTASMAILGASVPVTRMLLAYPPAGGQALRYGLAAAALAPIAWHARRDRPPVRRADWQRLAATAACGLVAFNFFLLGALRQAEPAAVATVLGAAPICLAVASPLLRGKAPALRIVAAAAIVVVGTACLSGFGDLAPLGVLCAAGALAADVAFSLLAAPLVPRLGAVTVAAVTCTLAVPMFLTAALVTGEAGRWRPPEPHESAAIVFLGLVLTAGSFVTWFHGLRHVGPAVAGLTMGAVPVAALTVTCLHTSQLPSGLQMLGIAAVITGLHVSQPTTVALLRKAAGRGLRIAPNLAAVVLVGCSTGCASRPAADRPSPADPVRAYFTALEEGAYPTAYTLSRSARQWLASGGLATGYRPPTGHRIVRVDYPQEGGDGSSARVAYVRVRYLLGELAVESTVEVWRDTGADTWSITSGSNGRLDVIAPGCPRLRIADVEVEILLTQPRVSGGRPSAGFFELPPGIYTIAAPDTTPCRVHPVQVAVPAVWRDADPVAVHLQPSDRRTAPMKRDTAATDTAVPRRLVEVCVLRDSAQRPMLD